MCADLSRVAAATHAFPRSRRLLHQADFQQVFRAPWKSSDAVFTVLAAPAATGRARLGLAIARKQLRRATDRNRIKRLVREYFRQHVIAPLDYVVMARRAARTHTCAQLSACLACHFQRLATHA